MYELLQKYFKEIFKNVFKFLIHIIALNFKVRQSFMKHVVLLKLYVILTFEIFENLKY